MLQLAVTSTGLKICKASRVTIEHNKKKLYIVG